MIIRPCRPEDVPTAVRLVSSVLANEFPKDQAAYPAGDLERIFESYAGPGGVFLVAEEEGRIVGTCGVKADDPKSAILRRLFVDPGYRKRGIGGRLLQEALAFCRQKGFREVVIRTADSMEEAIRLCTDAGFQEEGRWSMGPVTLVRFCLRLT